MQSGDNMATSSKRNDKPRGRDDHGLTDVRYAHLHYLRGCVLWELERYDEAKTAFVRALQIRPDYAYAHCGLGIALQSQGKLDEAAGQFDRAVTTAQAAITLASAAGDDERLNYLRRQLELYRQAKF